MPQKSVRPKAKILLDTNVWRYVVDQSLQGKLLHLAANGSHTIQIAPAVMYELLRLQDVELRHKLVKLAADRRFERLMPEAYSESIEILQEIVRVRSHWLRPDPNRKFFTQLEKDWSRKSGGFWIRCSRNTKCESQFVTQAERDMLDAGREQAKRARREIADSEWKRNPPMDKTLVSFRYPVPGWRGDAVEAWRVDALTSLTYALGQPGNAYGDWMRPFINFGSGLLRSPDWTEFWLYSVEVNRLPRQWIRWAVSFAQRFRKVTPGTPADAQLSSYFVETDYFITADRALLSILDECRPYSPCNLPEGRLISGGASGVEKMFDILSS